MTTRFLLKHGNSEYGEIFFNGEFIFKLHRDITLEAWNREGFIKLPEGQYEVKSNDLFEHLNSRIPIPIRDKSQKEKLAYIKKTG